MESAIFEALKNASSSPGFTGFVVLSGLLMYIAFRSGVVVSGDVAKLRVEMATLLGREQACEKRCTDLEKRIGALETENMALIKGMNEGK